MTYLDSSVLLRPLLHQPSPLDLASLEPALTGRIARIEVIRVLERLHRHGAIRAKSLAHRLGRAHALFRRIPVLELEPAILDRAEAPMPVPLGTLDALHIATALHYAACTGDSPRFATHDRTLAAAARACGLEVVGA